MILFNNGIIMAKSLFHLFAYQPQSQWSILSIDFKIGFCWLTVRACCSVYQEMVELRGQVPLASSLCHHCHCLRDVPSLQQKPCVWLHFQHAARKTVPQIWSYYLDKTVNFINNAFRMPAPPCSSLPMLHLPLCSSVLSYSRLSPSLCHLQPHCHGVIPFNVPFSLHLRLVFMISLP